MTVDPHDPAHRLRALVENAIGATLAAAGVFVPLSVRAAMARTAIEAANDWLSGTPAGAAETSDAAPSCETGPNFTCGHTRRITIGGQCGECTIYPPRRPPADMAMPPGQWCRAYGVTILDPDGWRHADAHPWDEPVTLAEFWRRAARSTIDAASPGWAGISRDLKAQAEGTGDA